MEEYRISVKKRMQLEFVFGLILVPLAVWMFFIILHQKPVLSGTDVKDFIGGFFIGVRAPIVAAVSFYLFAMAFRDHKAMKNEAKLKQMRIEEKDERKNCILLMSSKTASWITMYTILVACVISSLINPTISITLLIVWTFMAVVRIITTNYYESKM